MKQAITFEKLVGMTEPFRKRRHIFFAENSPAYVEFGEKVYGHFIPNKAHQQTENIDFANQFLKIDAQVINGQNKQLGDLRMKLFYKGVHFADIDMAKSFPEPLEEDD